MNDFIRKLFFADDSEMEKSPPKDSDAAKLARKQGALYEQLKTCLVTTDWELLDQYADNNAELSKEEQLRAFRYGVRCAVEFFIDVFSK